MGEKARLEKLWIKYPTTFRMDSGQCFVGGFKSFIKKSGVFPVNKGDLIIKNPTKITYGIPGAGDRIGWVEKVITKEMIGQKIAVFTSIEDKSKTDRIGYNQLIFYLNTKKAGGISKVYREGIELTHEQIIALPRRKEKPEDEARYKKIISNLMRKT